MLVCKLNGRSIPSKSSITQFLSYAYVLYIIYIPSKTQAIKLKPSPYLVIDYCASNPCDVNAECSSSVGSFSCACNPGYTGDGFTCTGRQLLCFEWENLAVKYDNAENRTIFFIQFVRSMKKCYLSPNRQKKSNYLQ